MTITAPAPVVPDDGPDPTLPDSPASPDTTPTPASAPVPTRGRRGRRKARRHLEGQFSTYPHLLACKPRQGYVFRSDYFHVDDSVATILAYFHNDAAHDGWSPFWGINRIPYGLDERVTTVVLEQVARHDDRWVDQYTRQSEKLDNLDARETSDTGSIAARRRAAKVSSDLEGIIGEIQDGASYLSVQDRLLIKAPDLETLDASMERIRRLYNELFKTLSAAPYTGAQRAELAGLLAPNDSKKGPGFHLTSTEYAGSYSLVTNGLNDPNGEYVGTLTGDVNSSAVLFDVDRWAHHVVVADDARYEELNRVHVSDLWCSKISQAGLLGTHSVVHIVLDGVDLDQLGPRFDRLTARVDLGRGDVNMFEMFGDVDDELAIYSTQMEKLKLMFNQLYESSDGAVASIVDSALERTLTDFYVDQRMWVPNAKAHRDKLRVVGIPHEQVPRLQMFQSYLDTRFKALSSNSKSAYQDQIRAYDVLRGIARSMLSTNGDLFNNFTADAVDGVRDSRRVIYDLSRLMRRGRGVAMAQLVNVLGFAVGKLGRGDMVIIHGTEHIDDRVKDYMRIQFEALADRGGRVVYSYNKIDAMIADRDFNNFDTADYTVLGPMRDKTVEDYQTALVQKIAPDLKIAITQRSVPISYVRRGFTNVVFRWDLALGINPAREAERREIRFQAARAETERHFADLAEADPQTGAGPAGGRATLRRGRPKKSRARLTARAQQRSGAEGSVDEQKENSR